MVAAIICCTLDVIGVIVIAIFKKPNNFYGRDNRNHLFVDLSPIYIFVIASDGLCIIGAVKKKKCMLLPFIIKTSNLGTLLAEMCFGSNLALFGPIQIGTKNWEYVLVIGLLSPWIFGLCMYSLVNAIRFFGEISFVTSGRREVIALQPISSQPTARSTEVVPDQLHSGEQNQIYEHQEQAQAYQPPGDPKRNVGIRIDCSSNQV